LATYPWLKAWAVVLPAVVLFFSARSFGSYLVTLLPAALVAACSVETRPARPAPAPAPVAVANGSWGASPGEIAGRAGAGSGGLGPSEAGPWRHWRWVVAGGAAAVVI